MQVEVKPRPEAAATAGEPVRNVQRPAMMHSSRRRQRGMTMISWMIVLGIAVFFVLIGIKMVPTYMENYSIKQVLANMEQDRTVRKMTPKQMRDSFFKRIKINGVYEFDREWITISKDKDTGGTRFAVDYEIRKPVAGNVAIVMAFSDYAVFEKR
jgi:hypothetical protein